MLKARVFTFYLKLFYIILLTVTVCQLQAQIGDFDHVDFKKADSIALSYPKEDISNLPQLTYKLTSHLKTDAERFRAIYRWVCANIKNDYSLYLKNKYKREKYKDDSIAYHKWQTSFRQKLFKKLLQKKRTICTGYAYLVKTMSKFANIECELINGYGKVSTTDIDSLTLPNHSWNAVKLNGKWYLCDPTWASGIPDPESNRFTFHYNDGFFLTNPELFAVNHFPIEEKWWLMGKKDIPTFGAFLNAPIIYGSAYKRLDFHFAPTQMHHHIKTSEKVVFKYQLKEGIRKDKIRLVIDSGYNQRKIKPSSSELNGKLLNIEHQFNKTGFYDVHLYLGEDLISTYTVEVEN